MDDGQADLLAQCNGRVVLPWLALEGDGIRVLIGQEASHAHIRVRRAQHRVDRHSAARVRCSDTLRVRVQKHLHHFHALHCSMVQGDVEGQACSGVAHGGGRRVGVQQQPHHGWVGSRAVHCIVQRQASIHIRHSSALAKHLQQVLDHLHAGLVVEDGIVQRQAADSSVLAGSLRVAPDDGAHHFHAGIIAVHGDVQRQTPASISHLARSGVGRHQRVHESQPRLVLVHRHVQSHAAGGILHTCRLGLRLQQHLQGVAAEAVNGHQLVDQLAHRVGVAVAHGLRLIDRQQVAGVALVIELHQLLQGSQTLEHVRHQLGLLLVVGHATAPVRTAGARGVHTNADVFQERLSVVR
mmetsp:Transcript_3945/g.6678  ORF Transcript_3945/g.6678 Transcript_3945/m.6678 type:complete len:353 (-) Transcript_3945:425-1483(-)